MSNASVLTATLDHLALGSPQPEALAAYYARALGLAVEPRAGGWWGHAAERRIHFLPGEANTLGYAGYRVSGPEQLEGLKARLAQANWPTEPSPSPRFPDGVCLRDPDGNRLVFGLPGETEAPPQTAIGALPARIQHIVVSSTDAPRLCSFFEDVLGFAVSDNVLDDEGVVRTSFLRCSTEHHSFAVFQAAKSRLDHHCYEAGDWGLIRDWGDHMASEYIPIQWGPGRHGPGNNLFLFIHDLDGNWLEISAELEVIGPDRPVGVWPHAERTLNVWGKAFLRS